MVNNSQANNEGSFEGIFERIMNDHNLLTSQLGLIMALYYYSHSSNLCLPFQVSRRKLMAFSKIRSISTYHRCVKTLVRLGYIDYVPSYHPLLASNFRFLIP